MMSANKTTLREHIRAQMLSSDRVGEGLLEEWPPLRIEKNLVVDPVGNGLLADGGVPSIPQPGCNSSLASGDLDGFEKSSNVRLIHKHRKYTNWFVSATTPFVCQENKAACIVLTMPTTARKPTIKPPPAAPKTRHKKRQARPGMDGRTLGERLAIAMAHETGRRGREYRQADLLADVNRLARTPEDDPALTQQMLSAIMRNQVTRSSYTTFMAVACHVDPLWLGDGIGNMTP